MNINSLPTDYTVSGTDSYCAGTSGLTVNLSGSETGINYQLQKDGADDGTTKSGTGAALDWLDKLAGEYTVIATNATTNCTQTMSASAILTEDALPVANAGDDVSIAYGTNTTLNGSASGGSEDFSYSWEPADSLVNALISNPQTVNLEASTQFTLIVSDNVSGCQHSDDMTLTITGGALSVSVSASEIEICYGSSTELQALSGGGSGNYTYSWTSDPVGFTSTEMPMNAPKSPGNEKKSFPQTDSTILDKERYLVCEGRVHLTGIQALVVVENALMVLRRGEGDHVFAIDQDMKRSLFTHHKFFQHDTVAGLSEYTRLHDLPHRL